MLNAWLAVTLSIFASKVVAPATQAFGDPGAERAIERSVDLSQTPPHAGSLASRFTEAGIEICTAQQIILAAPDCLNSNGDFEAGTSAWVSNAPTKWQVVDGQLFLKSSVQASTTFSVEEGQVYDLSMFVQSNGSPVSVKIEYLTSISSSAFYTQDVITFTPRGGSVYTWTVQAPVSAKFARLTISNGGTDQVRLDNLCVVKNATGSPIDLGCTNVRTDFLDGKWNFWFSNDDDEVEVRTEKGLRSLEIGKDDDVFVYTYFPARANRVYTIDLKILGEKAKDKNTYVTIIWENSVGAKLATTEVHNRDYPDVYSVEQLSTTAPNLPGISRGRLQFETRPEAKVWINRACITERGSAGSSSLISGRVFADANRDGRRDATDGLVGDVSVHLYKDNGDGQVTPGLDQLIASRLSSVSSGYSFASLAAGSYYVIMSLPPTKQVSPRDAFGASLDAVDSDFASYTFRSAAAAVSSLYALTGENEVSNLDLGLTASNKSAVSGYVWADLNGDKLRNEPAKTGLNGVEVESTGPLGTIRTETTFGPDGAPGYYLFNYIEPQTVKIKLKVPTGAALAVLGGDNAFSPTTAQTASIALAPNATAWNRSAALIVSATEVCGNGIDDDLDGRIDDFDDDCSTCTVPAESICGEPYRHFLPPVWMMEDTGRTTFVGPAYLRLSTSVDSAYVTIRNASGSYRETVVVKRTVPVSLRLDERLIGQSKNANTVQSDRGLLIESDFPVQGVYFLDGTFNKALVTLKGHQALGNRFRAGSQVAQYLCPGGVPGLPKVSRREAHFVSVMATEDNTEVTFTFDETKLTLAGGLTSPHTTILQAGQTYLVRDDYTNQTVSGLLVTSDKAISVVSGSQHTNVCSVGGLDAGIDQLVPECYVGREYVAVKHKGLDNQHYAVVVPTVSGTEIFVDGDATPVATVDAGSYYKVVLNGVPGTAHFIRTSAPAYVYHISGISTNNEVGMAIAASVEDCRGDKYLRFLKGDTGDQQLSIILPTSALASLNLNGVKASTLSGVIVNAVISKPTVTAVTIAGNHLTAVNTIEADEPFQAALLIGISGGSGTYGYLSSFSPSIVTLNPAGRPSPRYTLPQVCAGESFSHTVNSSSCGTSVRIVSVSHNSSLGEIEVVGALGFKYVSSASAGGVDNIALRLRDDNGLETSVCLDVTVCGGNVEMGGLPNNQTLAYGAILSPGNAVWLSTDCKQTSTITYSDVTTAGSCPAAKTVVRTWRGVTSCGIVVTRSRTFTILDKIAPTFGAVPASKTFCRGESLPTDQPTVVDNATASADISLAESQARTDFPGTNYYEVVRRWTATDACGNTATTTQLVRFTEVPQLAAAVPAPSTCGVANGSLRIDWSAESRRTSIALSINGVWQDAIPSSSNTYTFTNLAAGSYVIAARWSDGACAQNFGTSVVASQNAVLGTLAIYDLATGASLSIVDGQTYDLRNLPVQWQLRAPVSGSNPSVRFSITGEVTQTVVQGAPSFAYPNATGAVTWQQGQFRVQTEAFNAPNATGDLCVTKTVNFRLVTAEDCGDGIDNDGDGLVDCNDEDCPKSGVVRRVVH